MRWERRGAASASSACSRAWSARSNASSSARQCCGTGRCRRFAVAIRDLKKVQYTKTPLRTDLGWHVVQLTDTREAVPPPFENEQVQEQLVQAIHQKQFDAWVDGLVAKSKIMKTP